LSDSVIRFTLYPHAEQAGNGVQFEVASVKTAEAPAQGDRRRCTGGPERRTRNLELPACRAHVPHFASYDLELYQFKPPEWMASKWFAIIAKVPAGTTKEQFRKMQQNLLEERFKLAFHRQPKEMTVYDLVVARTRSKCRSRRRMRRRRK